MIRGKLSELVKVFREETSKLTKEEINHISNLDDFFPPCQLFYIHFKNLSHDYLIVTHDQNREDVEIDILELQTWEVIKKLEDLLRDPKWDRELTKEEKMRVWKASNYKEIMEGIMIGIIKNMEGEIYRRPIDHVIEAKLYILGRDFKWDIFNIDKLNPSEIVEKLINEAKQEVEKVKSAPKSQDAKKEEEKVIKGYGTYFYPPIWVGTYPEYSFTEKIRGRYHFFLEKSVDAKYKGRHVIFLDNGYIGIAEKNIQTANRLLNEIMGTGLLFQFPLFSVRYGDMSEIEINEQTMEITSRGIIPRGYITRIFDIKENYYEPSLKPYFSIKPEGLKKILELSEVINEDEEISDCINLLTESYTCIQSSQYMTSFVMSWTIIEKFLYWSWDSYLKRKKINKKRRKKLTSSPDWNISSVIEVLNINGLITNENYTELDDLRRKRNNIVHEGEKVNEESVLKCYTYAFNTIIQRTQTYEKFDRNILKEYVLQVFNPKEL